MGFFLFNKKRSLLDAGIFKEATDWHCHILPGVDDGIATMSDALAVLEYYEQIGIREVWLTPHVLEDMPNTTQHLRERYDELKAAYSGGVTLHLAAENMIDGLFQQRLGAGDLLPVGTDAGHLLVEFSYMQPPMGFHSTLKKIGERGLIPVIAHPERYAYMDMSELEALKSMGCKLQLNILSLVGAYGETVARRAQSLLSHGMYDVWGTDIHNLRHFKHLLTQPKLGKETVEMLKTIGGSL